MSWCLLALSLLIATSSEDMPEQAKPVGDRAHVPTCFEEEIKRWRRERHARLLAPYGWLSLVGLHWLEGGEAWRIGRERGDIVLGRGPEHVGVLIREEQDGQVVFWLVEERGRHRLGVDARGEPEGVVDLPDGVRMAVIRRGERFALRVWDPASPLRQQFGSLDYFPPSKDWVIEGRFIAYDPPRMLAVADVLGMETPRRNPGRVAFSLGGRTFSLEALQEKPEDDLFFVFADRTNGKTTYGGGRFLYAPPPDARGQVVLDFNRAYNPPCAFTPYSTCPLPPPENRLDVEVTAGEKRYQGGGQPLNDP